MYKCSNCKAQISWKQAFKSLLSGYSKISCKSCGQKLKVSIFSRIIVGALIAAPLFPLIKYVSDYTSILMYLGYSIILFLILPFLIRYKKYQ